jgi:hypothetical protein
VEEETPKGLFAVVVVLHLNWPRRVASPSKSTTMEQRMPNLVFFSLTPAPTWTTMEQQMPKLVLFSLAPASSETALAIVR